MRKPAAVSLISMPRSAYSCCQRRERGADLLRARPTAVVEQLRQLRGLQRLARSQQRGFDDIADV